MQRRPNAAGLAPRAARADRRTSTSCALFRASVAGCVWLATLATAASVLCQASSPTRIVSIIPAVTEMLFAIGAGPRVVGVSNYDRHPAPVRTLARVGGLLDPDVERILSLRPDLVIVYATQSDLREQLARAQVPAFLYRHGGLADVTRTIRDLGTRTGKALEAGAVASDIERRLGAIRARVRGRHRPRTLLVFGREPLALRTVYASGAVGFLHDMLETAGGTNVFGDVARESVQATTELILARAPEVIIELREGRKWTGSQMTRERDVWTRLTTVPAVRLDRIHLLAGDGFLVPGPRVVGATEHLARVLHPEAFPERN